MIQTDHTMKTISHTLNVIEITDPHSLTQNEQELIEKCIDATTHAWTPYSGFNVGAAILLDNGEIITGSNQENSAYPSGLCAERVTLFSANHQYPDNKVLTMAVCAKKDGLLLNNPVTPCGSCRQVITESNNRFNYPMKLILVGASKTLIIQNSNELLPLGFNDASMA